MGHRLLFCNIGWMSKYRGITPSDKIVGGGAYVHIEQRGHEVCNFLPTRGKVYGYVQPHGSQIKIERLGATKTDEKISGIDVVFTARRPGLGGTVVVGWYKNATVYRYPQHIHWASKTLEVNQIDAHWIVGSMNDVVLLASDQRNLTVPRGKGGMGQSNVWFADSPSISKWISAVQRAIGGSSPKKRLVTPRQQDPLRKAKVEKAAIETATNHYTGMGYIVRSVEKDNVGWDIEASEGNITLLIEVKGLSGTEAIVELTPNEYKQMMGSRKSDYRLCIVTNALQHPKLKVFTYNHVSQKWACESDDAVLQIKEKISAVAACM